MYSIADHRRLIASRFLLWLGLALVGCGGQKSRPATDTRSSPSSPSGSTPTPTATATGGNVPCPATGQWSDCAVFQALDRAGLAPRRDSSQGSVTIAPLSRSGTRLL